MGFGSMQQFHGPVTGHALGRRRWRVIRLLCLGGLVVTEEPAVTDVRQALYCLRQLILGKAAVSQVWMPLCRSVNIVVGSTKAW